MTQVTVVLGCRPSERAWPRRDGGNLVGEDFHSNSRKGRTCRRGSFASFRVRQGAFVWMVSLLDSREHAQDAQRRTRKHSVRHPTLAVRGCAAAAGEARRVSVRWSRCAFRQTAWCSSTHLGRTDASPYSQGWRKCHDSRPGTRPSLLVVCRTRWEVIISLDFGHS